MPSGTLASMSKRPDPIGDEPGTPVVDRRKLDEIFGDVLPDITADESEPGSTSGFTDGWYRENRPPHHDG